MKRFLLLLLVLMGATGAWADVTMPTPTTDTSNPALYCIQSWRSQRYVQYAGDNATITQTFDFTSLNTKFYFVPVNGTNFDDGVKIVSNVNGKKLKDVGTGFDDNGSTWYIKENPYKNGFVCISKNSNLSANCWDCNANGVMTTGYWRPASGDADGTSWQIVEVPQYETSTLANPKWYYIQTGRGRYVYANGTKAGTATTNPKTDDYKFAFISTGGTGVNIVSKTGLTNNSNKYLTTDPGLSNTAATWYYFNAARYPGYFMFSDNSESIGYPHLLNDNGAGGLAKWYEDGTGSYFRIEEVLPLCDVTYTYTYGGKTYTATETQNIGAAVSLPSDIKFPYTNYSFSTDVVPDASTATINVTVTGFDMPFTASTDYATATWYFMTLRGKYLEYSTSTPYQGKDSRDLANESQQWAFIGNPIQGVKIINKAAGNGKYLSYDNAANNVNPYMKTTQTAWVLDKNTGGFVFRMPEDNSIYMHLRTPNLSTLSLSEWVYAHDDAGSTLTVEEVPDIAYVTYNVVLDGNIVASATEAQGIGAAPQVPAALAFDYTTYTYDVAEITSSTTTVTATPEFSGLPFKLSKDYARAQWHYLHIHGTTNYQVSTDGANTVCSQTTGTSEAYQWAFIGNPIQGIKVVNRASGSGKWLQATNPATMGTTEKAWTLKKQTSSFTQGENWFGLYDSSLTYLNVQSGTLKYWGGFDAGSSFWAIAIPNYYDLVEAEIIPYLMDGEGNPSPTIGQVFGLSQSAATNIVQTYLTQLNSENFTEAEYNGIKALFDAGILYPEDGKFYVIKNVSNGKYINVKSASGIYADADAPTASSIVQAQIRNGKTYFATQGKEFGWCYWASNPALLDAANAGKYARFVLGNPGQAAFAHSLGNGEGSYEAYIDGSYYKLGTNDQVVGGNATDAEAQWTFEEASEVTVSLNSVGGEYYATLCVPFDFTIVGAHAHTLSRSGNVLTTDEQVTVAAGTPVLLNGTAATATIEIDGNYTTTPASGTALTGVFLATTIDGTTDYVLGQLDGKIGFYHWSSNNLKANRAYIAGDTSSSSVKGYAISWDGTDAIQALEASEDAREVIYNLAGQRVSKAERGVYIINGKKVVKN
ncbi:MAG: hypothetical protein IJV08_04560 [Bacteroidaceae bacterium]|nr:hypothetical protein [Bacteroidaceae bacterium]